MIRFSRYVSLVIWISLFFSYAKGLREDEKSLHLDTIFIRYYNHSLVDYVDKKLDNIELLVSKMDPNKPTVLYIHGYKEYVDLESVSTIVCAYLQRNDHNVLALDYRNISRLNYFEVSWSVTYVAHALASALNKMVVAGLNPNKLHIIGHSMGGQVAGHLKEVAHFQIPRITGLDPAGPLFNIIKSRLTSADAQFVDIIHTDSGFYGNSRTTGNVDFFPNGGQRLQPGCKIKPFLSVADFCSHFMSWKFYAISLLDENLLTAVKCSSYLKFLSGKCNGNMKIPMGYATPTDATGTFYLKTSTDTLSALNVLKKCLAPAVKYRPTDYITIF